MRILMFVTMALVVLLVACAPTTTAPTIAPTTLSPTSDSSSVASPTTATVAPAAESAASLPAWMTMPLTNARTGESFTLADFSGKTVLARAMALWCTNCRSGQRAWRDAVLPQVDAANTVFVSFTIETNITAEEMAAYADENSFPWVFAVMTPEFLQALNEQFGSTINVPPVEPQWLIRPDGSVVGLISDHSSENLVSLINGA
jgi:thiol-disulfide isomerase/thioredoxin